MGAVAGATAVRPAIRLPFAAALLDFIPLTAFLVVATLVLRSKASMPATAMVAQLLLIAIALERCASILLARVLSPRQPAARLLPLPDSWAQRLYTSSKRIAATVIYGYFGLRAADRLGLPPTLNAAIAHLLFLTVAIMLTGSLSSSM